MAHKVEVLHHFNKEQSYVEALPERLTNICIGLDNQATTNIIANKCTRLYLHKCWNRLQVLNLFAQFPALAGRMIVAATVGSIRGSYIVSKVPISIFTRIGML